MSSDLEGLPLEIRFVITRRLGAGAMGTVDEAHDPDLNRRVPGDRARARELADAAFELARADADPELVAQIETWRKTHVAR